VSVLVIFRAKGNTEDLLARYDAAIAEATETAPVRPDAHYCVPTGEGIMIVDVWRTRADVQRAVIDNLDFQRVWDEAGWPDESIEIFEVHNAGWPG
jgi:hypothetical protein